MLRLPNKQEQVINNINNTNIEIDYDKLADAIVSALQRSEKETIETQNDKDKSQICDINESTNNVKKSKRKVLKSIFSILRNEVDTDGEMTIGAFSFLLELFFRMIALFGSFIVIIFTILHVLELAISSYNCLEKVFYSIITVAFCIMALLFFVLIWGTGNEISREKDKNYLMTIFSSVTGLIALIISLMPKKDVDEIYAFLKTIVLGLIG